MLPSKTRLWIAIGLQLLVLALVPARQVKAALLGQEITLATAPVDPFDHFSGPFVRLAYEVEQGLSEEDRAGAQDGDAAYVVVEQAEPAWRRVGVRTEPPPIAPGRAVLRATWQHGQLRLASAGRFYLPAEKAKAAEQALADQRQRWWKEQAQVNAARARGEVVPEPNPPSGLVRARVDAAGDLRLLRLEVDGQAFSP